MQDYNFTIMTLLESTICLSFLSVLKLPSLGEKKKKIPVAVLLLNGRCVDKSATYF